MYAEILLENLDEGECLGGITIFINNLVDDTVNSSHCVVWNEKLIINDELVNM
jgi:hypothetical protein